MTGDGEGRAKRLNRGNNLFKLINQERELLEQNGGSSIPLGNDEEDVIKLLFNEDEDDEDMKIENEELNSNDEIFSGSGSSSNDEDSEYEGSDEESGKKRKLKTRPGFRRNKDVPILIKRKAKTKKQIKTVEEEVASIDLMSTENRRTSSRKSALENRLKVYKNLKEKEEIRIKNFEKNNAWRAKKVVLTLTQEDRMNQALETEKINVASLQRFREVEIYQQLQREEQQLRKKIKFKNFEKILRFSSEEILVLPEDDLKLYDIQKQHTLKLLNRGAKKKYLEEEEKKSQLIKQILSLNLNEEDVVTSKTFENDTKSDFDETDLKYYGPANKVSRNLLTLYNFNSTEKMTSLDLKRHFNFNKNYEDSADFERIVHCKKRENEEMLDEPSKELKVTSKQLQAVMSQFMKFGDFENFQRSSDITVEQSNDKNEKKLLKFVLSPSLFYKSMNDAGNSNVKKNCYLKCNEKVKYIDPKLNISYSDLEVYKNLSTITQHEGGFKWIALNEEGGMYYCQDSIPAKGVPTGF
ncbi:hypothetical protein QEN19_000190 [Hanseniaspora menglaensis]